MRVSSVMMVLGTAASTIAAPLDAAPLVKRADYDAPPGGDITILQYALTLEYLERKFYQEGLANYTKADFMAAGFTDEFYENLKEVYFDEQTHVTFLAGALGPNAVPEAMYSFPSTDAKSFVTLASVLEGVGVSAYLGAAAAIANKAYLTVAGSILTVEARHAAYIRAAIKESPFPKPFDTPLDFNQVFSLAAQFITSFAPGSPALPFQAFPPLTVASSRYPFEAGRSSVTFVNAYQNALKKNLIKSDTPVFAVFFSGLDTYYVPVYVSQGNKDFKVKTIPGPGYATADELPPAGQVYIVLSTADGKTTKVSDENTISGVGIIEVIPK